MASSSRPRTVQVQSPSHCAHIGQTVVIKYRWHPLYGREVRRQYSEHRASGEVVHVETDPGNVIVVPAWMLDPIVCGGMRLGDPHLDLVALQDLDRLLVALGFRSSSRGGPEVAKEDVHVPEGRSAGSISPVQPGIRRRGGVEHDARGSGVGGQRACTAVGRGERIARSDAGRDG
jgi:hypothetical protein